MDYLSVMLKPASSLCDMRCKYCFYCDIAQNRQTASFGVMSAQTAKAVIDRAFETGTKSVQFLFQGGEPTLAGIEFFEQFVAYARDHNPNRATIGYALQTNGLHITEEFADFFARNKFLVGLSLDGYADIHNYLRVDAGGNATHRQVMTTAHLFDRRGVDYNILTVVTAFTAKHIAKIYAYFKREGFLYLQFIPCLDPLGIAPFEQPHSLTPSAYATFLKTLFKLYYDDFMAGCYVSIRFFDNVVNLAAGGKPEQCGLLGFCPGQLIVESDGSVFPCDFYCTDEWRLGSIHTESILDLFRSDTMKAFMETSLYEDPACAACEHFALCRGGCRRNRDTAVFDRAGENIYCDALREFFTYAAPMIQRMTEKLAAAGR